MPKLTNIEPRPNHRLHLRYDDGAEGVVDLSHLAGRGVFKLWNDPQAFARVTLTERGAPAWDEQIDLCPDALYLQLTGKPAEQVFPNLRGSPVDA